MKGADSQLCSTSVNVWYKKRLLAVADVSDMLDLHLDEKNMTVDGCFRIHRE